MVDESDDNWESCSSDASEDEVEVVANESEAMQRQTNRKNVGIIDTIARLQQSISSQGSSNNVDGVEKLPERVEKVESKQLETNKQKSDLVITSVVSNHQDPDTLTTQSEKEISSAVKSIALTYETIVSEAMQSDNEDKGSPNVKGCVSNGRSPNINYSFNLKGISQSLAHLGSRNSPGGSSSNADSTSNDVDMVDVNTAGKILTRIDNIGFTRSTSVDSTVTFCCLIDECGFESTDLSHLLSHIDDHPVQWSGYCYTCNGQVKDGPMQLMMEFMHMTSTHYNKKEDDEMGDKASAGKSSFIKCKLLPGDKLSKSNEEEIAAKARQLSTTGSKPSASQINLTGKPTFKIASVKSLTPNIQSLTTSDKPASLVIANVVSLGSAIQEFDNGDPVSLVTWGRKPTNKLQKYCKRMLRDICLYALYKCMDVNCSFTTDNSENMLTHLRNHENISNESSMLECSYCDIVADSCALLIKHIQDEHQSSIFQCHYCFYRSCAAFNVIVHLKQFHPSEKKSVLVCHGKPKLYATEKALIEKYRRENIRALRCTEGKFSIGWIEFQKS